MLIIANGLFSFLKITIYFNFSTLQYIIHRKPMNYVTLPQFFNKALGNIVSSLIKVEGPKSKVPFPFLPSRKVSSCTISMGSLYNKYWPNIPDYSLVSIVHPIFHYIIKTISPPPCTISMGLLYNKYRTNIPDYSLVSIVHQVFHYIIYSKP